MLKSPEMTFEKVVNVQSSLASTLPLDDSEVGGLSKEQNDVLGLLPVSSLTE